jgi:hypothetical protein
METQTHNTHTYESQMDKAILSKKNKTGGKKNKTGGITPPDFKIHN